MAWKFLGPVLEGQSTDREGDLRRADELITQAIAIDPNLHFAHRIKGWVLIQQKRPEEAIVEGERSLALNPSFIDAYTLLCLANYSVDRPERTWELADKAIRLSPRDPKLPLLYWPMFCRMFHVGRTIDVLPQQSSRTNFPAKPLFDNNGADGPALQSTRASSQIFDWPLV
jgi:tetratricopeptide (TPR) repeat protein